MKLLPKPDEYAKKIALVLQGGGALGSYQCGVYEALSQYNYEPDWVAGISIGAINASLIAGNEPQQRVAKLREFWKSITTPPTLWDQMSVLAGTTTAGSVLAKQMSSFHALMSGQAHFFSPRLPAEWMFGKTPTSFYDTSALKSSLERLVDFDRINAKKMRFSVGAVNVRTGNFGSVSV